MKTIQKECQVLLLPTDKESNIGYYTDSKDKRLYFNSNKTPNTKLFPNWQPQHLYILSDEEIKEDNWCAFHSGGSRTINAITKVTKEDLEDGFIGKKIIATTNPELNQLQVNKEFEDEKINNIPVVKKQIIKSGLPKPTDQFIQDYISKGCPEKVNVEYEEYDPKGWFTKGKSLLPDVIKISSDNTITCSFIEDDFVKNLLIGLGKDLLVRYQRGNGVFQHDIDNWLKENYNPPTKK